MHMMMIMLRSRSYGWPKLKIIEDVYMKHRIYILFKKIDQFTIKKIIFFYVCVS